MTTTVETLRIQVVAASFLEDAANQRHDAVNAAYFRGRGEALRELLAQPVEATTTVSVTITRN